MGLILLRHTTPDVQPGICYGQLDLDVAATFDAEADKAFAALPRVDRIVTSPLKRCHKLAEVISDRNQRPFEQDARLMEMDFGTWEGVAWDDIPRPEIDEWGENFLHARPHGGENVMQLRTRAMQAISEWNDPATQTLIVTHAGIIRIALAKGDYSGHFNAKVEFGQVTALDYEWIDLGSLVSRLSSREL